MNAEPSARSSRRTKVVATIGPASIGIVDRLIAAGLDDPEQPQLFVTVSDDLVEQGVDAGELVKDAVAEAIAVSRPEAPEDFRDSGSGRHTDHLPSGGEGHRSMGLVTWESRLPDRWR